MNLIKCSITVIFIFLALSLKASVTETTTSRIGGNGGSIQEITCRTGTLITGVKVKYGDVIDRIKFRCTKISPLGKWSGSHSWTTYSRSDSPIPATKEHNALCSQDRFVGAVKGKKHTMINYQALSSISIGCYKADPNDGNRVGNREEKIVNALKSGSQIPWTDCDSGLAKKSLLKRGFNLDSLQFSCQKWVSGPSSGSFDIAPPTLSPLELIYPRNPNSAGTLKIKFNKVANIHKYDICVQPAFERYSNSSNTQVAVVGKQCFYKQLHDLRNRGSAANINVTLPKNQLGKMVRVRVKSCNESRSCGKNASSNEYWVRPQAPRLTAPANNASILTEMKANGYQKKTAKFQWQKATTENSGYQFYIWRADRTRPDLVSKKNPPSQWVGADMATTHVRGTSLEYRLDSTWHLRDNYKWAVATCIKESYLGNDVICGKLSAVRRLNFSLKETQQSDKNKSLTCGQNKKLINGLCINTSLSTALPKKSTKGGK